MQTAGAGGEERCGWLPEERRGPRRLVWVRGRVATEECPKSLVTPQSLEWMERFFAWKFAGGGVLDGLPARDADAFLVLEKEWREWNQEMANKNPSSSISTLLERRPRLGIAGRQSLGASGGDPASQSSAMTEQLHEPDAAAPAIADGESDADRHDAAEHAGAGARTRARRAGERRVDGEFGGEHAAETCSGVGIGVESADFGIDEPVRRRREQSRRRRWFRTSRRCR